jgi:predicted chitinase
LKQWFDTNTGYGYQYRGGGVIQLTWDSNYTAFSNWDYFQGVIDPNIMAKGSEYVAFNYPWEAAVFFWATNRLNAKADEIPTGNKKEGIRVITRIVTGASNPVTLELKTQVRFEAYEQWENGYTLLTN